MRIVLRLITVWLAINAFGGLLAIWRLLPLELFIGHAIGRMTVALVGCLTLLAGIGATQLWRFRESGRRLALAYVFLTTAIFLYMYFTQGRLSEPKSIARFALRAAVIFALLSPAARALCHGLEPTRGLVKEAAG